MKQSLVSFRVGELTRQSMSQGGERVVSKFMERNINSFMYGELKIDSREFDTAPITISLPDHISEALKAKAKELDIPVSKLLRLIAEKAIEKEQQST